MSVENSNGVNESCGVNWSAGVNMSDGVNESDGVNWSAGVNMSDGVNESCGVNMSDGVNRSKGVNWSAGVNWSDGVNRSKGVNWSYGVLNSYGVDRAIFLANKKRTYSIFGVDVSEERFDEVFKDLRKKLNGWFPKYHNAFEMLDEHGEWSKVPIEKIKETPETAWKDMPKEAIDYIKSLPEFNADMFKEITGIDVDTEDEVDVTVEGKTIKIGRKSAIALGLIKE